MAYNELVETTFPDPESRRDVRDWHGVCGCKRVTEGKCGAAQARPRAEAQRFHAVMRSAFVLTI